jgi:hypothetical protein
MSRWILILASGFACSGCTTMALERHALRQGESAAEVRYQEVLENLALVAHDPAALPAYSSIFVGTTQVTDSESLGSTTLWVSRGVMSTARAGFLSETASPLLTRNVSENWALDPLIAPEKIEALRCACRWVIYGPETACGNCPGLLLSPEEDHSPGRHFGVAQRLARLPGCWLHVGGLKDVPLTALYKAHFEHTWVWVMPDGMEGLADFTLIFQDIARVQINSDSLFYPEMPPCAYSRTTGPEPKAEKAGPPATKLEITAYVSRDHHLVPGVEYRQLRFDNLAADSSLRSAVSASSGP